MPLPRLSSLLPTREQIERNRWLAWLRPWLGHSALWHWSRRGVALGVALGVFFGLLVPIAQIPLSAAAAIILRANIPAAAASTLVTNPVTFAPIYVAAYHLGAWVTGVDPKVKPELPGEADGESVAGDSAPATAADKPGLWQRITSLGKPLIVGLAILATLTGLAAYAIIDLVWRWRIQWRIRKRRLERQRARA